MLNYLQNTLELEKNNLYLWYFASFIFGILFYFTLFTEPVLFSIFLSFLASAGASFLTVKFTTNRLHKFIIIFFTAFLLGILTGTYRTYTLTPIGIKDKINNVEIEGVIKELKPNPQGILLTLGELSIPSLAINLKKIRVHAPEIYGKYLISGDRVKFRANLNPPPSSLMPESYDFSLNAFFKEIGAVGRVSNDIEIIEYKNANTLEQIFNLRKILYHILVNKLGEENGNFAAAIFLGETGGINRKILTDMRYAGISHILCVSGLHLSLVAMIFFNFSRLLLNIIEPISYRYNIKKLAAYCSLIGSLGYLLLTGLQIAATRAFIMTAVATLAIIISRTPFPMRSLSLAAFIILLFNPEFVINPSFQLSFIAVVSLISGYEFYLKNPQLFGNNKGIFATLKLYLISNIYSCLVASLATAPIVIYHFYIFSNYSIPANLVAVPLMSFIIMPVGLLAFFTLPLPTGDIFFNILNYSITTIKTLADYIVSLPHSVLYPGYISPFSVTIFFIGFLWLTLWQTRVRLLGVAIISLSFILASNSPKPKFVINFAHPFVLIHNDDNYLEAIAPYLSPFSRNFLANWYGFKELKFHKIKRNETIKVPLEFSNDSFNLNNYQGKFLEIDVFNKKINFEDNWHYFENSTLFFNINNKIIEYKPSKRFQLIQN